MMMASRDRRVWAPGEREALIRAGQGQVQREIEALHVALRGGQEALSVALRVDQGARQ